METFLVKYIEFPAELCNEITFECADMETCKIAVNQWRVNEKRLKNKTITIKSIQNLGK
jgi:hypothetical protein